MVGCIPTRVQLRQRYVDVSVCCPLCNVDPESTYHVFVSCPISSACWFAFGDMVNGVTFGSFKSWLIACFDKLDNEQRCRVSMLCWAIWKACNDLIWNRKPFSVVDVCISVNATLEMWRKAQDRDNLSSLGESKEGDGAILWAKPAVNSVKVNVDAAIFEQDRLVGFVL